MVQAGADAHFDDPLADLMLTTRDYERIFRRILEWADAFTSGRVLFTLGGGYSLYAAPRVWAMLYLLIHDLPVPPDLRRSGGAAGARSSAAEPPEAFHDANPLGADIPNREEIAHRNRQVAQRLLEGRPPVLVLTEIYNREPMFQIIAEGRGFSEYVLLRDGESVLLRTATADDIPAVEALMRSVSPEALQLRFMGAVAYVSRSAVEFMCTGESRDRLSLLAIAGRDEAARVAGIGTYTSIGVGGRAEVAFLVQDEFQGRGISTLLLERLAGIAAGATDSSGSRPRCSRKPGDDQRLPGLRIRGPPGGPGRLQPSRRVSGGGTGVPARTDGVRERIATANSIAPLLRPRASRSSALRGIPPRRAA